MRLPAAQPDRLGYALVVAYATDGNSMIVDRINRRRVKVGVAPLQISVPLREIARKFITMSSADEAGDSLLDEAKACGYATEGWRVRMHYGGSYAKIQSGGETSFVESEMADTISERLVRDWPTLLRPDWQDIGIAPGVTDNPELSGLRFQAEFVPGWRIPFEAERPAHFSPPMDQDGNPAMPYNAGAHRSNSNEATDLLGPVYQEPQPKPQRRRGLWPFRG